MTQAAVCASKSARVRELCCPAARRFAMREMNCFCPPLHAGHQPHHGLAVFDLF
jgi:hypothetical protein